MENSPEAPLETKPTQQTTSDAASRKPKARQRSRRKKDEDEDDPSKRRCVSTACIACRKRKSKCDGNLPACAACAQVYGTDCIYDPLSDHRRKGVYKHDMDTLKTRNSTLQTLVTALLNLEEQEAFDLVREIRSCESLDAVAEQLAGKEHKFLANENGAIEDVLEGENGGIISLSGVERNMYGKMGDLRLDDGSVRYIGGTSHLIHIDHEETDEFDDYTQHDNAITSWTRVTNDGDLILHLLEMYFTWHYTYFTTLSKTLFYRDFGLGYAPNTRRKTHYCTPLLVNAMLALGCHFTSHKGARADPEDSSTAGDHFFREAKRLILEDDLHEVPRLTTVQALALMSVREAGCAREAKGWVYSGMSFRMACDMGLNLNTGLLTKNKHVNGDEAEEDVRRITFWGCFLFDKCWSNYLGRLPQLPTNMITVPKPEVFLDEDGESWVPYTDSGHSHTHAQPARTRAVALQITKLCEISNDLMGYFYNPTDMDKSRGRAAELKMLSSIHTRLEAWRKDLPHEFEPKEGALSSVLTMHMFFQLLFIHLFRPFLKYTQSTSPLPPNVSPRKLCSQAAQTISKLMRLYKRSHGLRQICNIAVYILHSACTLHILNLPDKTARRDIIHGVKHLEEIADGWLCARRTLCILSMLARKWKVELPDEAASVLARTDKKFTKYSSDIALPVAQRRVSEMSPAEFVSQQMRLNQAMGLQNGNGQSTRLNSEAYPRPPTVPSYSDGTLPPRDADSLRATQHPSATATPLNGGPGKDRSSFLTSPTGMFGGVEQLLRDSQEIQDGQTWVVQDQTQLANGFDNWTGLDVNPSMWADAGMTVPSGATQSVATILSGHNSITSTHMQMPLYGNMVSPLDPAQMSPNMMQWLNGAHAFNDMATYDENSWYS